MAKKSSKKAVEVEEVAEGELIDGETGEVIEREVKAKEKALALSEDTDILAVLDKAEKAKKDSFTEVETDVWQPHKQGDGKGKSLTGVYLGTFRDVDEEGRPERFVWHRIGVRNPVNPDKAMTKRVKNHAALKSQMANVTPGQIIQLTYEGQQPSEKGNPTNLYTVRVYKGS